MATNSNNKIKKDERKRTIFVIGVLVAIILVAFLGISATSIKNSFSSQTISLQPIDVTVSSGGTNHSLSVKISLDVKNRKVESLNMDNVMYLITEELKNANYNEIVGINGSEKLKKIILDCLNENYEGIENVYLQNLVTDVEIQDLPKEEKNNSKSDFLKGFKWSN